MMIADAQIHIWGAHSPERPWPDPGARSHGPSLTEPDILAAMDAAGVHRAVLVPPSWDGGRNDLAIAAAINHPDRFAIMGRIPLTTPTPLAELRQWREQPGMLGLRFTFTNEQAAMLTDGTSDWLWPAAEAAGLPLMVLPSGLLHHFPPILEKHPDLRIVIDHMALPTRGPKDAEAFAEVPMLLKLARYPNVAVKVSALPCYTTEAYPYPKIHPYVRQVFDAFGPKRTFWGSDLSRLPPTCSYRQVVTLFTEEFDWLKNEDRDWVMGRGVCEWIGWN